LKVRKRRYKVSSLVAEASFVGKNSQAWLPNLSRQELQFFNL